MDSTKFLPAAMRLVIPLLVLHTLITGCSIHKIVPLQIARVSQTDTYVQTFEVNPSPELRAKFTNSRDAEIAELDNMLIVLLGKKNWQILKDSYGSSYIVDAFLKKKVKVKGQLNTTIYLEPVQHNKVLIEGFGRFFVLLENESILLSGDTHVIPKFYPLVDFANGDLQLESRFYVTRIPKHISNYHEASIMSHIKINNKFKDDDVYALNYAAKHEMFLKLKPKTNKETLRKIGYLKFDPTFASSKLVDFSGMTFVKEYDERMAEKIEMSGGEN